MPYIGSGANPGGPRGTSTFQDRYTIAIGDDQVTPYMRVVGMGRLMVAVNQTTGINTGSYQVWLVQQAPDPFKIGGPGGHLFRTVLIGAVGTPEIIDFPIACRAAYLVLTAPTLGPGTTVWDVNLHGLETS